MTRIVSLQEVNNKCKEASETIIQMFPGVNRIRVYGIPRGGITIAYAIASYMEIIEVVGTPEEADLIVDDLTDSGRTMDHYVTMFPDTPFFTVFGRPDEWLVFPWEGSIEGSAEDIPTRLLQYVGDDPTRGGLIETPKRFLKAWDHFTSGYGKDAFEVLKVFEDGAEDCDEMVLVRNIPVYSQCEHHLVPFFGVAHVAYIPNGKIVGLSKLSRVVDIFARRLQVQERLTNQIAQALQDNLEPLGVGVVLECRHLCMESRGICQQGHTTITSSMKGVFRDDPATRAEFLGLIKC